MTIGPDPASPTAVKPRLFHPITIGVLLGALLAGGILGYQELSYRRALSDARQDLISSLPFHAAETAERYRERFTKSEEGCEVALGAFAGARRIELLGWAIESCEAAGIDNSDLVIAKAVFHESMGSPETALRILREAGARKPGDPTPFLKMAQIYTSYDKPQIARDAWVAAVDQAPKNAQITLDALRFCYQHSYWPETKRLALAMRPRVKNDDVDTLALVASALERSGDSAKAFEVKKQVLKQVGANQKMKERLSKAYPEVFGGK